MKSGYQAMRSSQMPEAAAWYRKQRAIQVRGLKTKLPHKWKNRRIGSIKSAMQQMGRDKEDYYAELADRLNKKKPFTSLTKLTKTDLERVYRMVLRDAASS